MRKVLLLSALTLAATHSQAFAADTNESEVVVLGLGTEQASESGVTIDELISVNQSSELTEEALESQISTLSELEAQMQHKNDQLTALVTELTEKQTEQLEAEQQQAAARTLTLNSNAAPALAAAHASRVAHSRSTGYCARYVRRALQAAGYSFTPNASAYQYATRGTLSQAGFVKISNNLPPQVGDVVVFSRTTRNPHGHIQIFNGSNWVSDFRQNDINPYSNARSYTTWRDARYLNNASQQGIYLAMTESE